MKLVTNKSKNLLYRIVDGGNVSIQFATSYAIATQISADSATWLNYKCQYRKNSTYLRDVFTSGGVTSTGKITRTFTTPADLDYNTIVFGLNGKITDTLVSFPIKLKPSTTYTFTCNFTNITQGSISWKDMMLVEGSTVGDYEPYSYNLLDKWKFPATTTTNGVTFTNNGDGTIAVNGTANAETRLDFVSQVDTTLSFSGLDASSKLMFSGCPTGGSNSTYGIRNTWVSEDFTDIGNGGITYTTPTKYDGYYRFGYAIIIKKGYTANNLIFYPQLYDLTLMYGAGNEPTTVSQFYTDHPELKVAPLGFIGLKNLEISNRNIKRLKYATTTRNLFDKSRVIILTAYIIPEVSIIQTAYFDKTLVIPCEPNTTYTFSKQAVEPKARDRLCIAETSSENPEVGTSYINAVSNGEPPKKNTVTITTTSAAKNLLVTIGYFDSDNITTLEMILATCQLEKGSTATSYVPYGYLDLGIIPSNSGYILNQYNNLSEELLEENIEKDNINYHIPDKTNILLNKIEGKTNKIVQEIDITKTSATTTKNGVTCTNNRDGSWTVNGTSTATETTYFIINNENTLPAINGHTYCTLGCPSGGGNKTYFIESSFGYDNGNSVIYKLNRDIGYGNYYIGIAAGYAANNLIFRPQVFDLTAMYGFGKEPTTVEQFKKDYPQFFDSKLDGIWNVRTSGISTTGKNLFDIDSVSFFTKDSNGEYKSNKYINIDDVLWTLVDGTKQVTISGYIKCPVGKNYMFRIVYTDGTDLYRDLTSTGSYVYQTITSDSSKTVSFIGLIYNSGSNEVYIKDVQIEEGSTATTYEPYIENKIDLLSTQTLNGINGVNDYIEVIDKGNGLYDLKKTQNIASVNMGSLGFDADGNNFVTGAISPYIKPPVNDTSVGNYICQKYVNCALNKSFVDGDFGVNSSGYIYFRNSAYTTAAAFQTAVTGTMLYYQLKTPVTTTIATNLTYNQVSAIRTNGGLLLVNDNNNQKYVQPDVTLKENFQYKS